MYVVWQVNGVEMTGKSQSDAVAILRAVDSNSLVSLIVSRQIIDDTDVLSLSDTVCLTNGSCLSC